MTNKTMYHNRHGQMHTHTRSLREQRYKQHKILYLSFCATCQRTCILNLPITRETKRVLSQPTSLPKITELCQTCQQKISKAPLSPLGTQHSAAPEMCKIIEHKKLTFACPQHDRHHVRSYTNNTSVPWTHVHPPFHFSKSETKRLHPERDRHKQRRA